MNKIDDLITKTISMASIPNITSKPVTFEDQKREVLKDLASLKEKYDNLSKSVAPKYWRLTGTHFLDLTQMEKEVGQFEEIEDEDLKDPWIKEQLGRK